MHTNGAPKRSVAVVIGTGFHRWVLGPEVNSPLCDWPSLLKRVASSLQVAAPDPNPARLALAWETLLLRMVSDGYLKPESRGVQGWIQGSKYAVNYVEKDARKVVCKVLMEAAGGFPIQSRRARFFLDLPVSDVVSLNFDEAWVGSAKRAASYKVQKEDLLGYSEKDEESKKFSKIEFERLYYNRSIADGPRVWFPNGHLKSRGTSIRLGTRDFGFQAHALAVAFGRVKDWERTIVGRKNGRIDSRDHAKIINALPELTSATDNAANHWVTPFMLRPLFMLGVGLSAEEQGLWWLLVQRARNRARVQEPSNVYLLLNRSKSTKEQIVFWSQRQMGVEPLWCDSWDAGWELAAQKIQKIAGFGSR